MYICVCGCGYVSMYLMFAGFISLIKAASTILYRWKDEKNMILS